MGAGSVCTGASEHGRARRAGLCAECAGPAQCHGFSRRPLQHHPCQFLLPAKPSAPGPGEPLPHRHHPTRCCPCCRIESFGAFGHPCIAVSVQQKAWHGQSETLQACIASSGDLLIRSMRPFDATQSHCARLFADLPIPGTLQNLLMMNCKLEGEWTRCIASCIAANRFCALHAPATARQWLLLPWTAAGHCVGHSGSVYACVEQRQGHSHPQLVPAMTHHTCNHYRTHRSRPLACAGTLPSWPNHRSLRVFVMPGNEGLCGPVRSTLEL